MSPATPGHLLGGSGDAVVAQRHDKRVLQERLRTEEQLIADATESGWSREVERHRCTPDRIRSLLIDLEVADGSAT